MTPEETIAKIEAERRRREKELLLILLLIAGQARRYAVHAVKLGHAVQPALREVWLGNAYFRGVPKPLARVMADAHLAGYARASSLVGETTPPPMPDLVARYAGSATEAAGQMLATLAVRLNRAVDEAPAPSPHDRTRNIRAAFESGGYTADNPTALKIAAEVPVVKAYADGMANAFSQPTATHTGYRHHSVDDKGTTVICKERGGLLLPKDDPYWLRNWPPLHFGCRSVALPVFGFQQWSTAHPVNPPSPGFGSMPAWLDELKPAA